MNKHLQKLLATLTGSLVVLTLLLGISSNGSRAASLAATVPSNWIKGANMIGYARSIQAREPARRHCLLEAVGGNAIAFAPRWFMDAPRQLPSSRTPALALPRRVGHRRYR